MKKTLLALSILTVAVSLTQAQGLVNWGNTSGTRVSTNSTPGSAAAGLAAAQASGGAYYYALFYSTTATAVGGSTNALSPAATTPTTEAGLGSSFIFNAANGSSWTLGATGTNTSAGRFLSSTGDASFNTAVTGLGTGSSAEFFILGWSANLGTTYSALLTSLGTPGSTGFVGQSVVAGPFTSGDGNQIPTPATAGTGAGSINGFTLGNFSIAVVPEPTTLALAGLGGASLLLFRRRK